MLFLSLLQKNKKSSQQYSPDVKSMILKELVLGLQSTPTNNSQDPKIKFEEEALDLIRGADGALRDALTIYDRMVSFTNRSLTVNQSLKI